MKKIFSLITVSVLLLINTSVMAITKSQAEKYIDRKVFLIVTHTTSVSLYGKILDVIKLDNEDCLVLDGKEYHSDPMILLLENITYIRERKYYE